MDNHRNKYNHINISIHHGGIMKYCPKCRKARKLTGDKHTKCLIHGLSTLCANLFAQSDKQKLQLIKLEMRLR